MERMKKISKLREGGEHIIFDYITDAEKQEFCYDCNEICSRHCPIYRKAEIRQDEEMENEVPPSWSERYLNTLGMSMRDFL